MLCQNSSTLGTSTWLQIYLIKTSSSGLRTCIKNSSSKTLWYPPLCHPSLPSLLIHRSQRCWRCPWCWCHWCCCRRRRRRRWYHCRGLRSYARRLCYGRLWRCLPEHMRCCCGWLVCDDVFWYFDISWANPKAGNMLLNCIYLCHFEIEYHYVTTCINIYIIAPGWNLECVEVFQNFLMSI